MLDKYMHEPDWSKLCLLLDYDGTLAPHGSHPDLTILPEKTRQYSSKTEGCSFRHQQISPHWMRRSTARRRHAQRALSASPKCRSPFQKRCVSINTSSRGRSQTETIPLLYVSEIRKPPSNLAIVQEFMPKIRYPRQSKLPNAPMRDGNIAAKVQ